MKIEIFKEITSGFSNLMFPTKDHEALALVRSEICAECTEVNPTHTFVKFIPGLTKGRGEKTQGMGCNACGCYLPAKVRSPLSKCPKGKW